MADEYTTVPQLNRGDLLRRLDNSYGCQPSIQVSCRTLRRQ